MKLDELSHAVDEFYSTREKRLALQKKLNDLEKKENLLKEEIIAALQGANAKAGAGSRCVVTLQRKNKPICGDWLKLYDYITQNNEFDLLQRRLGEGAVQARWEEGLIVPGVEAFPVFNLSISQRS